MAAAAAAAVGDQPECWRRLARSALLPAITGGGLLPPHGRDSKSGIAGGTGGTGAGHIQLWLTSGEAVNLLSGILGLPVPLVGRDAAGGVAGVVCHFYLPQ